MTTTSLLTASGAKLTITDTQLVINNQDGGANQSVDLEYIYGAQLLSTTTPTKILINYCHVDEPSSTEDSNNNNKTITDFRSVGKARWELRTLAFDVVAGEDTATAFVSQVRQAILPKEEGLDQTRVHVILNPVAGGRLATQQWKETVKPMLLAAGFQEKNIILTHTEANGKTRVLAKQIGVQLLSSSNDSSPPIVICMGGDGTVHEVVNGLSDAFDGRAWSSNNMPTFRLGIIPSGSGNAFSLSLNHSSIEHAALKIIKGKTEQFQLMDATLEPASSTKTHTRLLVVMSYGFHAQIVSKSRYLQYFMGNKRFSLVAMFLLKFLWQYPADLVLKGAQQYDRQSKQFIKKTDDDIIELLDSQFTYFLASKQKSLERGFPIAPFASPFSPDMDVVVMRNATSEQLQDASIKTIQGGRHVDESDIVEYYKAQELELRVKERAEICLDGEIVNLPKNGVVRLKMIGPSTGEPEFRTFV